MPVCCGIDLGTTFSTISWFDAMNNRVDTIDLDGADGAMLLRSVVFYPGSDQTPVVGETAWNAKKHQPERVIDSIKRSMGTSFKTVPIDGIEYTPAQVSAEILKALVKDAQTYLGEEVRDVVITVPAYFGDKERAATQEAGEIAGLNVLALLPEPHAAALAFAVDKAAEIMDRCLLVYDLGGGTFDVTLIRARAEPDPDTNINLKIDTLCKDGNAHLGGLDWDRALAELVAEKVMQDHDVDVWQDPKNEATLLYNCEKAKRHLTRTPSISVVADLAHHQVDVTAADFEDRTRDLLTQSRELLEQVLLDAENQHQIARDQIDVLLAGGSSRMPMVKMMIEGVMGRQPLTHKNPELLVSVGAAYWAHLLQEDHPKMTVPVTTSDGTVENRDVVVGGLTDVSTYGVGVEVLRPVKAGGYEKFISTLIPKGARYGEVFEKEFATSEDNMSAIPVVLYKGESENREECEWLMDVTIAGLPAGRPKGQRVKVMLGYDDDGIIRGRATDLDTASEVEIIVDRNQ